MVHAININKTTTLHIPTEEEWRKAKSEYHDRYIKRVLSGPEKTDNDPK